MTHFLFLGRKVAAVDVVGLDHDRHLLDDLNPVDLESADLLGVVGHDPKPAQAEVAQDLSPDPVIAFVGREPELLVGFDGIQTALEALRQGRINATIAQKPEKMGALAVSSIARFWRGEKPASPIRVDLEVIEKR